MRTRPPGVLRENRCTGALLLLQEVILVAVVRGRGRCGHSHFPLP
jgi:hypothetical protein